MTWHHPNYYKKLRAARKKIPVSGRSLDRATGPAENLNAENSERFVDQATSSGRLKPQALKLSNQPQASSAKRQASQPE